MKLLLTFSLLFSILSTHAQDSTRRQDTTRDEDYDKIFTKVEIEATYPGGPAAWGKFMSHTLRFPDEAVKKNISGVVVIQFIVDKEGHISDVEAISGPDKGGLREEGIRMIRKSGLWEPAIQHGHKVRSYKKQPIMFTLDAG